MPRTSSLQNFLAAIALLALTAGCSQSLFPNGSSGSLSASAQTARFPSSSDPFTEGVNQATRAANLAQTAQSPAQWDEVAKTWLQAIYWMQSVPPTSPKRAYAQKKVAEYMRYLVYAQQRAGISSRLSYPTFNSEVLDEQLGLYLSYVAAIGRPDILIVGSSRALQGVDPSSLQQALASQRNPGLKIFNFGVNGATAQVVNFQLQKLLSPDQLPRLILWADGVRAFNSGREDRTYNAIASSPGYQRLASGIRPRLSSAEPQAPDTDYEISAGYLNSDSDEVQTLQAKSIESPVESNYPWNSPDSPVPPLTVRELWPVITAQATIGETIMGIDSNGFLPVSSRFNPATYYQERPYVAGLYDADYAAFQLSGKQAAALDSVVNFTQSRQISLLIVNLPLTNEYLDSARWAAEQEFKDKMRVKSGGSFVWRDLSQRELSRNEYFADPSHLNLYGAAAIARTLGADSRIPWPRR